MKIVATEGLMPDMPRHLRFGSFRLDTVARELHGAGDVPVPLTGKAFDTLCSLIAHRDRVVGKDELLAEVWPGRVVEENNLSQAISTLRRALGEAAGVIVTVPGRGYRFIGDLLPERAASPLRPLPLAAGRSALPIPDARAPRVPRVPTRALAWSAVALAGIAAVGMAWRLRTPELVAPAQAAVPQAATLAVLPFRSLSTGASDPLLELGLAETLIARASDAISLRVHSLSSSQRVAGDGHDPLDAGRALGADYVIEGTTQRDGERVRVNARLLSVRDGSSLWSGTFDEGINRAFLLQDAMASAVSDALAVTLRAAPSRGRSPCDGADPVAYRAYLVGRYQLDRPSAARMRQALTAFHRAIDRDPSCARAYAGMAFAYRTLVMIGDEDPRERFPLAQAAVDRALAIDPELAEAHASLGFIRFWYDWDWAGSEAELQRAIALNPSSSEARLAYAHLLGNIGRSQEAASQARQAVALDPLSPLVLALSSSFLRTGGFADEATRAGDKALEIEPEFWIALLIRGSGRIARKDWAGGLADLDRARAQCGDCSQALALLGHAHALAGDRAAAATLLRAMEARDRAGYFPATSLALVRTALGDHEGALTLLERGYAERDVRMAFLRSDPRWQPLYGEPRFQALVARMKLSIPGKVAAL